MSTGKIYYLYLFILLGIMGVCKACQTSANVVAKSPANFERMRGVCWEATRDSTRASHIRSLEDHHVNWISQTPFGWQTGHDNPEITFHRERGRRGERDRGLALVGELARAKGIKTLLKPHIWIRQANGKWRSDIEMNSEEEWNQWFAQYEAFILHYAQLAEQFQFEGLCIGTELYIASTQHEQRWRDIISKIRKVYSGQLTYAANFYKEYEEIAFWDELDYIGIQGYFSLTNKENPSLQELKVGWEPHFQKIKQVQARWQKPIVFTEIGYRSSLDAAIHPWEWEKRGEEVEEAEISIQTQALCYQAMFETFWQEKWINGFFIWKWTSEIYKTQPDTRRRRKRSPLSFTPKQPGLEVIKQWYTQ